MGWKMKLHQRRDPKYPSAEQPNLPGFIFAASQTDKELQPTEVARGVHHAGVRERLAGKVHHGIYTFERLPATLSQRIVSAWWSSRLPVRAKP